MVFIHYVPYKASSEENFQRQQINTNRKFHSPVDHLAHTLGCMHLSTPHFRDDCCKQGFMMGFRGRQSTKIEC